MKFPWKLIRIVISQESINKIDSIQKINEEKQKALSFQFTSIVFESCCVCTRSSGIHLSFNLWQSVHSLIWVKCCYCWCLLSLLLLLLLLFTTSERLVRQGFRSKDTAIDRARHRIRETKRLPFCCSSFRQNNNGPLKETKEEEEEGGSN
jgi:hypothetical protein